MNDKIIFLVTVFDILNNKSIGSFLDFMSTKTLMEIFYSNVKVKEKYRLWLI